MTDAVTFQAGPLPPMNGRVVDDGDVVDYDFDAAWRERRARAPRVRILGRVYELPRSVPAKLVLFAARAKKRGDSGNVDPDQLADMLGSLLGRRNLDALLDEGLDLDQLGDVMKFCMSRYGGEESGEGEAQAPAQGAMTPSTYSG